MSEILKSKEIVILLQATIVLIIMVEFFLATPAISNIAEILRSWVVIISRMAILLGLIKFIGVYGMQVKTKTPGKWIYSAWSLIVFFSLLIVGLISTDHPLYQWSFVNIYTQLGQTMYATTGFFILSSAYRAFKLRNLDSAILLISGVMIMLTNAPIGAVIWNGIPVIGVWIKEIGQTVALRTFKITASLGLIAYGYRVITGKEGAISDMEV